MPWEEPPSLLFGLIAAGLLLALIRGWRRRHRRRQFGVSEGSSLPYGQGLQENMQRMREEAPFRQEEEPTSADSSPARRDR